MKLLEESKSKSKERILLDETIKKIIADCEDRIINLRQVFKIYKAKNEKKVEREEMESRSNAIDLLRKNINLLQKEFDS